MELERHLDNKVMSDFFALVKYYARYTAFRRQLLRVMILPLSGSQYLDALEEFGRGKWESCIATEYHPTWENSSPWVTNIFKVNVS